MKIPRVLTAVLLASAIAAGPAGPAAAPVALPARVVAFEPPISEASYPTYDYGRAQTPRDDRVGQTTWRVVEETGNCCETYMTTTPDGRLLDFGGRYINYTDDDGLTWRRVLPLAPLVNGEGAIVAAPGGDILGVEWDPYSGDHLQFYKYEADVSQWLYTEMPVHQPFYDREWIGVLPGPVTVDGETVEYVSFVKGAWPSKEVWFYSTDGLHYDRITSKQLDQLLGDEPIEGPLPTAADPGNDWYQLNTNSGMAQLGGGDLLATPDYPRLFGPALLQGESFEWSSYRFPDGSRPAGLFHVDSEGRLHNVIVPRSGDSFDYRISADGGRSWTAITVPVPDGGEINEIDFRANAALGIAAVAFRAHHDETGSDQDYVYKLDITGRTPRVTKLHEVGRGDAGAVAGFGNSVRFDFESVAIFPDGRVAVSFLDSTTRMRHPVHGQERSAPAMAIEMPSGNGKRPSGGPPARGR